MANDIKPKSKFSAFLDKHSKKIIVFILVLISLSLIGLGYYIYYKKNVIATVNGDKITRSEFAAEKTNYSKMATYMDDSSYATDEKVRDVLVEQKIMDIASSQLGLTVSNKEIDSEIAIQEKAFLDKGSNFEEAYSQAYGLDSSELRIVLKYKLLKQKIEKSVVKSKEGKFIYARFNDGNNIQSVLNIKTEDLDSNAYAKVTEWKSKLDSGMKFDDLYSNILQENKYPAYYGSDFQMDDTRDPVKGEDGAIYNTEIGHYSNITKTPTYYSIYYIESGSNGKYNNWDDFIKDYSKKYVKYGLLSYKSISDTSSLYSKIASKSSIFLSIKSALASNCSQCTGCHGAHVNGNVKDTLGNHLSSASVSGTTDSSAFCDGSSSSKVKNKYCGYRSDSASTDTKGNYKMGGVNGNKCTFNCAGGSVKVTADKGSNYTADSKTVAVANGSTSTVNFSLSPVNYTLTVKIIGSGEVDSPSGGIVCGNGHSNCDNKYSYDTQSPDTRLTATASTGYMFSSWTKGQCSSPSSNVCPVDMDRNRTITATFTKNPVTTPAATCSISASPGTINSGGSSTLTFSSSNAISGSINGSNVGTSGATSVSPTSTTTYTYNVGGSGGSGSCSAVVSVSEPYYPPATTVSPTVSNSFPGNGTTLSGNSTKLTGYITLPGYKYNSTDDAYVTLKIVYAGSTTGSQTGLVISDPVRLTSASNSVQFTIDTSSLAPGKYTWRTFGWISAGSPKDTSVNGYSTSTFSSSAWYFTVPEAPQPAPVCQVSPITGDNPLTVSIGLSNNSIAGPYTIDFADGTTTVVNSFSNLPYYHTYNKAGSYSVTIKTSSGTVICATDVTVSGSTNGNGGEVTP